MENCRIPELFQQTLEGDHTFINYEGQMSGLLDMSEALGGMASIAAKPTVSSTSLQHDYEIPDPDEDDLDDLDGEFSLSAETDDLEN